MGSPAAVVLDVNETLFSLDALQPVFDELGISRELWFGRTLRTGFALTCMGKYRTFPEVAESTLRAMGGQGVAQGHVDLLLQAFGRLDAHPDVAPALTRLRQAKVPVVTLSVGNAANVGRLFERAGLSDLVVEHLSCEAVLRWKPDPEPYVYACTNLGLDPTDVWMVAAHSWDIGGAMATGMHSAFVNRLEGVFDASFGRPDVLGEDLVDVVEALLA